MVYQIFDDNIETSGTSAGTRNKLAGGGGMTSANGKRQWETATSNRGNNSLSNKVAVRSTQTLQNKRLLGPICASLLIFLIKFLLFIYDTLTFPVYFLIQRPDKRAREAQQIRSQQVDANTWIRTSELSSANEMEQNFDLLFSGLKDNKSCSNKRYKYMGATLGEIFARSVREYNARACLGYRAVVTCPVFLLNETGQSVCQEQSFRSDYTWYTYGQIGRRVQDIASGLYESSIYPSSGALFMASACLEWFCVAQACFQLTIRLIVFGPDLINDQTSTLALILNESEVDVLFVSCDQLDLLCGLLSCLFEEENYSRTTTTTTTTTTKPNKVAHTQEKLVAASSGINVKLKKIILIDWQFSVDFNETIFTKLGQTLARCRANVDVLSIGQIEEIGTEFPIHLQCSSSLSEENLLMFAPNLNSSELSSQVTGLAPARRGQGQQRRRRQQSRRLEEGEEIVDDEYDERTDIGNYEREQSDGLPSSSEPVIRRRRIMRSSSSSSSKLTSCNACETTSRDNSSVSASERYTFFQHLARREQARRDDGPQMSPAQCRLGAKCAPRAPIQAKADDLAMIVYAYGALGQLKPILLSHSQLARSQGRLFFDGMISEHDVHCSILPLASVIEFMTEACIFSQGGSIGYSCNMQTFFHDGNELFHGDKSDLETLNPSFLLVKPYLLERLRSSIQDYIQLKMNPIVSFVYKHVLYEYKKYWAQRHFETPLVDRLFCFKLKQLFGNRIKYILCNGATDCSGTKDFFAFMVGLPVIELYGPDEALVSLMSVNDIWDYKRRRVSAHNIYNQEKSGYGWRLFQFDLLDNLNEIDNKQENENQEYADYQDVQLMPPTVNRNEYRQNLSRNILIISSILCPTSGTRIRLEDWEEFRFSDRPYPRGRLVIGGDLVCCGYLNRPSRMSETFYEDLQRIRWFRTGDIARVFPNGSFEIISAISDMIKMIDGQFISLSQIEHTLRNSQFVDNVCAICGDDRLFVIILVVPNLRRLALKSPGKANVKPTICLEPEPEELIDVDFRREVCNDRLLCEFISDHLSELVIKSGLAGIVTRLLLVPEIWTPESELVTPTFKPKRGAIQKFYANDIQSIVGMGLSKDSQRLSARRRHRLMVDSNNETQYTSRSKFELNPPNAGRSHSHSSSNIISKRSI